MKSTSLLLLWLSLTTCVWAALPVTDGLVMYLDAETIQGVADGGSVANWADKSSEGNNATQSNADNQPTYVAASDAFEGQPAVRFNGETSWMELNSTMVNVGSFTLIAVANFSQQDTSQYLVAAQDGSGNDRLRIQLDAAIDGSPFLWRVGSSGWKDITAESDTEIHAFGVTSSVEGFIDGESVGTASNSSSENPTAFNIGSYNRGQKDFYDGDLAILVLYNTVLSDEDIAAVSTYLMNEALSSGPVGVSNPSPSNGANDIWLGDPLLTWTGADYSEGLSPRHRISLCESFDDVNDGVVTPVELDVNEFVLDATLDYGTTYYWMIEEANETSGWDLGPIWSFTTEPYAYAIDVNSITATASSVDSEVKGPEKTIDESGLQDDMHSTNSDHMWVSADSEPGETWIEYAFDKTYLLQELYVWNANAENEYVLGFGIKEAQIDVSLDGSSWTTVIPNVVLNQATGSAPTAVNSIVDLDGVFARYVRITALSNWSTFGMKKYSLSEVRFTQIPLYARLPQPQDGATNVKITKNLSWRPGRMTTTHDIYFGTDANALDLVATQSESSYAPSLAYNQTYYWHVDEVNDSASWSPYSGDLWSFSTPEYLSLEDFDNYDDQCDRIYWAWHDGAGYEDTEDCDIDAFGGNGSSPSCYVGYYDAVDGTYGEKTIVYAGGQSMPFDYDNSDSPYYSEASSSEGLLVSDWTQGGAEALTLFFKGIPEALVENSPSNLIISGSGTDIYSTADEFRFVYKRLSGDGSIVARVASLENSDPWAKAGVMIRSNLDEDAANALIYVSPENGIRMQQRLTSGDDTSSDSSTASDEQKAVTAPTWLKIERSGTTISAFYATDEAGSNWVEASGSPQDVTLSLGQIYIGLAVCSHNAANSTVAEFTDISSSASGNWAVESIGTSDLVNSAEQIYVKVTDSSNHSKTIVHDNPAATQTAQWTQWNIPLSELTGVNLSEVEELAIGVGDGSSDGEAGRIYIDELRLTRSAD